MSRIVDTIRYSKFGRKFLKDESSFYVFLRGCKRFAVKAVLKVKSKLPHEDHYDNILSVFQEYLNEEMEQKEDIAEQIDVIVPIYNGYEYLERLFEDLPKAGMNCRFILVDDKSTDERVHELESRFVAEHDNAVLLENEENYGFVKTVNHGLSISQNHVALINTDTELPEGWLKRLMFPILHLDKIASSTPYTNSATIFSFPNFCYNNRIYKNLDVDTLDSYFRKLKPVYAMAPTGVGFCMGMNKNAIKEVGVLDYETFERGFGEENDWCQRAIKKGYLNVQVENLFVYHKHGGSFVSEEKEKLIESHMERLHKKYPTYDAQVSSFIRRDPNKNLRQFVQMLIDANETKSVLYFDHSLGGGATSYLNIKKQEFLNQGACVSVVRYRINGNNYHFLFDNGTLQLEYEFQNFTDILEIGKHLHFDEIYINELVTYPGLWDAHKCLVELKEQQRSRLIMLFHDYFPICPTVNLMGTKRQYCGMPEAENCEYCYQQKGYGREYNCESHAEWVKNWKVFLEECTEVRAFSEDTFQRVQQAFGGNLTLTLVPHQVEYAFPIQKRYKTTDTLNIGLLGVLAIHKGSEFVRELLDEIERQNANVKIKLIGYTEGTDVTGYEAFSQTGKYEAGQLPKLIYENDIDIFLISSVWPETFSYTAEEIMKMGIPVATFDLGAPAERICKYEKGLILKERNPETVLEQITDFAVEKLHVMETRTHYKKVIFLAEYISFSSRYRMEHMWEELLFQGVRGELWKTDAIPAAIDWKDIEAIVIYRCRYMEPLKRFIKEVKNHHIKIFYDIDDFIFDYDKIKMLPFMAEKEYKNFDVYSKLIHECMANSDALLVSTEHLKDAAQNAFPDKPIFVNRNVASAELLILSVLAQRKKAVCSERVVIGYFSGSHTHNRDFEVIADWLAEFMKKHENVYFKVVGCLELPKSFQKLQERIIRINFMDWQKLPEEIATVDINLMPLENSFFNECKSENKWMEAALVKTVTIASYNEEIAGATVSGENILFCKTREDWLNGLERLTQDEAYRKTMAECAYDYVVRHKTTLQKHTDLLNYILEK